MYQVLQKVYPDTDWKPWLFRNTPIGYWEIESNRTNYFEWLSNKFQILREGIVFIY
jgi:hypothetical protein